MHSRALNNLGVGHREKFIHHKAVNVTDKMNSCGRLPGRKFPSSWPPMLIYTYISFYINHRRMSWGARGAAAPPESGKIIFFRAIEQFFGQRTKNEK